MLLLRERAALERDGFALLAAPLPLSAVEALRAALDALPSSAVSARAGRTYAARDLVSASPAIPEAAISPPLGDAARAVLGDGAALVRATLFDKSGEANWGVAWHQDVTIAVEARLEAEGFGAWSLKHGAPHVQPPARVLEGMLALRLHLDDCGEESGPLRALPGSHARGHLSEEEVDALAARSAGATCLARAGEVLAIRPLLVHASSRAATPARRRVIHVEYAADPLPAPLSWRTWVPVTIEEHAAP